MEMLKELTDKRSLSLAYTPGVAIPSVHIRENPEDVFRYTAKGNLVAVVTDGTAVLGLGDIGPKASIPVMEGKALLFKAFARVDAWPVPLENCRTGGNTGPTDIDKFVDCAASLAVMYGGINLEDIAAPACFEVEKRLQDCLDCPVFHDDQWGTAIITLAALKNYTLLSGKDFEDLCVVINGAGAAGIRIAETIRSEGVRHIFILDSKGVIHSGRKDLNPYKKMFSISTFNRTLSDALRGADVFIGVSRPGLVTKEMVRSMASYPAIFAMANPEPEIKPEEVAEAMGNRPYIMATGRSDYPNQINNVLGFPYMFRGALDVRAKSISLNMKKAAAEALAHVAQLKTPAYLREAYPGEGLAFGEEYFIPKPFDKRLLVEVSYAVAKAACEEGVASVKDITFYRPYLEALAYAPEKDCNITFIIDRFSQFGDKYTLCIGHDSEGKERAFICDLGHMHNFMHDMALVGRALKLSIKKGRLVDIMPLSISC